ncbi:Asp-tRNA(Asn)/Glu-tRNA(Gln) amidotransferase subunit GatC [Sporolituus thermophilus]|uniref:Aspartyl/glutamyl-tRNA(Asn/Gln) amidotransferase subunit C n=1 Tax=Sporolituus thermophilus DSM 23256 TaxID=1123285 RepID=A0A1G7KFN0_9FIRM|nr:Asp-tRNA(Asn)/Glu-tRNA(Gln) amidotransferase subunit GatC [Sporolituus thermophilus]SDF36007.1 aspartyl/glutamyl-tRNA(Asn/Gln) amidotransferase subunit C [Sporolituus thermophilus DSM 23256]
MKITRTDVEQVALLSRLEISDQEAERFTQQLNAILEYMDVLNKVDTEGIEPTAHVLPLKNVLREDRVQPSLDRRLALSNAPEEEEGYFKVPKILEG